MSKVRRTLGIVAIVSAITGTSAAAADGFGGDETFTVTATFADASPLVVGNDVKVDGVEIGQISAITLRKGKADVEMELDSVVQPIHRDATVTIRPVSLLGERYVDLDRGSADQPVIAEDAMLGTRHTAKSVSLDDLLNSMDNPTSAALAAMVTTLGEGTMGQGQNIDSAIKALAPAMHDVTRLGAVLKGQNSVLKSLLDKAAPVAKAVASDKGQNLDQLVGNSKQMLSAVAAQQAALDTAIRAMPGTLTKAQRTLAQVAGVANVMTPALRDVRPVTDNLTQVSSELTSFAESANPALASLPEVLDRGKELLAEAAPLVRDLRPAGSGLNDVATSARPLVDNLSVRFKTIMEFMKGWALSTNGEDSLSNYFRAFVMYTPKGVTQIPGVGVGPDETRTQEPQDIPLPTGPALPSLPKVPALGGLQNDSSATGLDQQQESAMLEQLLGGQ